MEHLNREYEGLKLQLQENETHAQVNCYGYTELLQNFLRQVFNIWGHMMYFIVNTSDGRFELNRRMELNFLK